MGVDLCRRIEGRIVTNITELSQLVQRFLTLTFRQYREVFNPFGNLYSKTHLFYRVIYFLSKFYVKMLKYPRLIGTRNWTKTYHWAPYLSTNLDK